MSERVIDTHHLTRRFGDFTAVNSLDLAIDAGTVYGFLGPNGSGKSTTIRMLTGLLSPTEGTITVLGQEIPREAEALRRRVGYMTQRFSLYEDLSVEENLRFMTRIYTLPRRDALARIDKQMADYDLAKLRRRLAGGLSGGQRQRLALAAATLHDPELLFLDEPTSAVDPENRRDFWEKLFDLSDRGTTILVSTHYMDEAERCHRLAILDSGVKRADGTPTELMDSLGARVVEIGGPRLRALKAELIGLPEVASAAQQGSWLRVLIDQSVKDPVAWVRQRFAEREVTEVRPSLEDVFVHSTGLAPGESRDDG